VTLWQQCSVSDTTLICTEKGLLTAIREWIGKRDISYELLDEIAGLSPRYSNVLLGHVPDAKRRRMTMPTLFYVLAALGVGVRLEEDPDQFERVKDQYVARAPGQVRSNAAALMSASEARKRKALKRWNRPRLTELAASKNVEVHPTG